MESADLYDMKRILVIWWGIVSSLGVLAQDADSSQVNHKRLRLVVGGTSVLYATSMISLGTVWYQDLGKFHFFDDNSGWRYMDKWGHAATAYQTGRIGIEAFRWTGMKEKHAIWFGGTVGLAFLTSVEIFDGMSEDWGFSWGDVGANAIGTGLAIGQELLWQESRISIKWSYRNSRYAQYRPDLLGDGPTTRWLKDYNGQTYWVSANIHSFLPDKDSRFPKWLNLAVGYGADGMTGADRNPEFNEAGEAIPTFRRYGQVYFGPDIDLSRIKTNSRSLNFLFQVLSFVKFPLPALEYNPVNGLKFHAVGF